MQIVTNADLCEQAHDLLVESIKDPYGPDGETYTEEAQGKFEELLDDLEWNLRDKGYQRNPSTLEWEPCEFLIGDPCLILGEDRFQEILSDCLETNAVSGRIYLGQQVPLFWARTVEGDGVFPIFEEDFVGEVAVCSGVVAFVPVSLTDGDHVFEHVMSGDVYPPHTLNIEHVEVSSECMRAGDVFISLKEDYDAG
jgi:hypothetical protein